MHDAVTMLTVHELAAANLGPISFDVARGECLAVTGPSGAGKSLLLRAIADLDPNVGDIILDGQSREATAGPDWRRQVTYLATEPGWWGQTVGAHFADWPGVEALVAELGLPASCCGWEISRLSTGERQRLGFARALMLKPRVLLLDEPTSGLDFSATATVESLVAEFLRQDNGSVIWVTHSSEQIRRIANRTLALSGGRMAEAGH